MLHLLLVAGTVAFAASPRMPLFETMLEERAFVIDLRATISVPTAQDHLRSHKDWPLSPGLCHRLETEIEAQFGNNVLWIGHFYADKLPDLPRVLMRLEFSHGDMGEAVRAKDRQTYARVLNGTLRVTLMPSGREVPGIPLRFTLTREGYGAYDGFKSLEFLDINGTPVTAGPINGTWDTVRHLNEGVLLDALFGRDAECDRLLF